jgi:hypothetical protein
MPSGRELLSNCNGVHARLQIAEHVVAIAIGGNGVADLLAIGIEQDHFDAGYAAFVAILQAVLVAIEPDAIADGGGLVQASIDGVIDFGGSQLDHIATPVLLKSLSFASSVPASLVVKL